tara:strand:- start:1764 stop:2012 length:249 start_codon:yes stop_codon:yes gene_type:complete
MKTFNEFNNMRKEVITNESSGEARVAAWAMRELEKVQSIYAKKVKKIVADLEASGNTDKEIKRIIGHMDKGWGMWRKFLRNA